MTHLNWRFDHSYAQLPDIFHVGQSPKQVHHPRLLVLNRSLAKCLGLETGALDEESLARIFSGQDLPPDARPIAQAYAGHQFGHFTMLGDGRALLLGEHLAPDGRRFDIQFKGSGPTPFSRRGDGLAAVGPMLREYLVSEAMHGLGVPTTRALAVVATGDRVWREEVLDGAILTRVASSHLRVGTFQYAAARQDPEALAALIQYALSRHDPELAQADNPALALLESVTRRQARLIAQWMRVGFVHGVMNTDNMTISGETIDYGPCAFMDVFDPKTVFSSIDHAGRYSYQNQPAMAQWNLARLAEALLSQIDADPDKAVSKAEKVVHGFKPLYLDALREVMAAKLGLASLGENESIADDLLEVMLADKVDYTLTFARLTSAVRNKEQTPVQERTATTDSILSDFERPSPAMSDWADRWQARLESQPGGYGSALPRMQKANPLYIPRNHLVEDVLEQATRKRDFEPLLAFLAVLQDPYTEHEGCEAYAEPGAREEPFVTFCGT
ncbi:protein adenylyltransferase SelO [Orrella marina]|uniref:Protein nucleotidyltransferase YdiU n=1 Tax=Orrella marina TaxID=2163011 RepID=A0A2R4XNE7_9BURK|nr:YdiU family protein [Orrella marina]AWB35337.1 YdiU family protein [Orrella marina]